MGLVGTEEFMNIGFYILKCLFSKYSLLNPASIVYELGKTCKMGSTVVQNLGYYATIFFIHSAISNSFKCV